jgi:hypothetical protein
MRTTRCPPYRVPEQQLPWKIRHIGSLHLLQIQLLLPCSSLSIYHRRASKCSQFLAKTSFVCNEAAMLSGTQ